MTQFLHKQLKKQFEKMQWNHSTRRRIQIEIPKEREKAVEIEVEGSMISLSNTTAASSMNIGEKSL